MKKLFGLLIVLSMLNGACTKDEFTITGSLKVTTFGRTQVGGIPIDDLTIGLFDISAQVTNTYSSKDVIEEQEIVGGQVLFENINYGNYVVTLITFGNSYRKAVQIRAGELTTVNLFD